MDKEGRCCRRLCCGPRVSSIGQVQTHYLPVGIWLSTEVRCPVLEFGGGRVDVFVDVVAVAAPAEAAAAAVHPTTHHHQEDRARVNKVGKSKQLRSETYTGDSVSSRRTAAATAATVFRLLRPS